MYTLRVFRGRCRLLSMDCGNFHKWILTHRDGYRPYTESNLHVTRYRRDVWEGCGCVYTFVCLIMLLVRLSFSLYRAYTIYLKTKSHRNFNSVEIRYEARVTGRGDLRSKVKDPRNWERKRKKNRFLHISLWKSTDLHQTKTTTKGDNIQKSDIYTITVH